MINKNDPRTYTFPTAMEELNYIKSFDKFDPALVGPHLGKLFDDF